MRLRPVGTFVGVASVSQLSPSHQRSSAYPRQGLKASHSHNIGSLSNQGVDFLKGSNSQWSTFASSSSTVARSKTPRLFAATFDASSIFLRIVSSMATVVNKASPRSISRISISPRTGRSIFFGKLILLPQQSVLRTHWQLSRIRLIQYQQRREHGEA